MEALIEQNSHSRGERRTKVPALNRAFRQASRVTIIIAATILIALAWIGARDAIRVHRAEALARVQAEVQERAFALEEELHRELLSLDQTLRILEFEWQRDPDRFDLVERAKQVVVISEVSLQIFIVSPQGRVRSSTRPAILGTDVSNRDYFRYEASLPADDGRMFVGELTQGQVTKLWQLNLVRRLDLPDGRFSGIIAASYDTNSFVRFYRGVNVGSGDLIAVVSMRDGNAWTMTGPGQVPSVINLGSSAIFGRMRELAEGNWTGVSPLDGVDRIYAHATVPDYGLTVAVGTNRSEAMADAATWERTALLFTSGITVLLILLAFILLRAQIAAQRRNETLARERAILEATLTGMSDGIMMVDSELRLVAWNSHFPEFTGVPREILRVGLPMEEILRGQVAAGEFGPVDVEAEVARRLASLHAGTTMGTIERPRPSGRQLEIRRNPLAGGGFVTLYTDVTARRQTEERLRQAQTMAAVGRLTAGVAHDFNNLLAAIGGNTEILHEQLRGHPEHAHRLAVILQATSRGSDLVRRLLAFSRRQPLTPALVNLNKILQGMGGLLRATLGRKVKLEMKFDATLWPALIDPVQIEHVILNLAINARDAMPDGGTLTMSTTNSTLGDHGAAVDLPAGDYVVLAVRDTGTGMTEEVQRNAFEPFFTTKPPGQGSGLGLSQVYGVASQSGGSVQIDSVLGRGTTVSVLFPRAAREAGADAVSGLERAAQAERRPEDMVRQQTILVVDDEADYRDTIEALLAGSGFAPVVAESAGAALHLIDGGLDFHLLLVDATMPDRIGVELARKVRESRPSVPVIFLASDDEWIGGERWVLRKPFLTRTLVDTVRAALALTQGKDAVRQNRPQTV